MKNCLAFIGFIVLALVAVLGMYLVFVIFGLGAAADQPVIVNGTPLVQPEIRDGVPEDLSAVETLASSGAKIEAVNPLDPQLLSTLFPTPVLTSTPLPPLDPLVYRTEVMVRARNFGTALEAFLDANEKLAEDNALLNDPAWRTGMGAILEQVSSAGRALAELGPPPAEYQSIDALLDQAGAEAVSLRNNYLQALETGDAQFFTAAGDNFTRIKEYLYAAFQEMGKAGWPVE